MVDFNQLLIALYEIQGASDPNHPPETAQERLTEIYEKASHLLQAAGWAPSEG